MLNAAGRIADMYAQRRSDSESNVHEGVNILIDASTEDE
jgi:hypothetical protein